MTDIDNFYRANNIKTLDDAYLEHIGTPHQGSIPHSGRYKYGSGDNPHQRAVKWKDKVTKYRAQGMSDTQIAAKLGVTTSEFRKRNSISSAEIRREKLSRIQSLHEEGKTSTEISKILEIPESTVRLNLDEKVQHNIARAHKNEKVLKDLVDKYNYLDVSKGAAQQLGITEYSLKSAIAKLQDTGEYFQHSIYVPSATNKDHWYEVLVLSKNPDKKDVSKHRYEVKPPLVYEDDHGVTRLGLKPIQHIDWDRVSIKYKESGGEDRDGVIQIKPGSKDLDLGNSKYAQVRIGVGGTHYLKGMAVYGDPKDFPKGKDIIFNTNKSLGTAKEKVLKPLKDDPDNPFGATIKPNGQKGAINKVNEEGDWSTWSKTLSSQFLSKQSSKLVDERIKDTYSRLSKEYDELTNLTNPVVKKALMTDFIQSIDKKRQTVKLIGISGMRGHVILPLPGIKANEIYAPNFKDGQRVVLVRYPHGGIFELPELIVNNKLGKGPAKFMQNAKDAVGIDSSVAQKLSGADFDGDTVMVIPNDSGKIKTSRSLKELKHFDSKSYYTSNPPKINTQKEMGEVSNLITDMTIKGATQSEIARAVKHSMVVIDAEKHSLDYKKSFIDNDIGSLKKKYQEHFDVVTGKIGYGASTLISRSKGTHRITETVQRKRTEEELKNNPRLKPTISKQITLKEVPLVDMVADAKKLGSGYEVENLYGDYINSLTRMRDNGYKYIEGIPNMKMSKDAKKLYAGEVKSLEAKLNRAMSNDPLERQAQLEANRVIAEKRRPDMSKDQISKLRQQSIAAARVKYNANGKGSRIDISSDEWEAIQAGAVSSSRLSNILKYADKDRVRDLATPKANAPISLSTADKITRLAKKGYTPAQIKEATGLSIDTIQSLV